MVAAITIPGLITNIRWIVLKQQYKEVYSTLNQALKLVYEKTDTVYNCYYYGNGTTKVSGECGTLYKQLKEVLKISTICVDKAYDNKCIPKYNGNDTIYKDKHKDYTDDDVNLATAGCDGYRQSNILNNNGAWVLANGTIIGFYSKEGSKIFFADVNGAKGPNKWGYDVHSFMIMGDGEYKLWVAPGGCSMIEDGGKSGSEMLK